MRKRTKRFRFFRFRWIIVVMPYILALIGYLVMFQEGSQQPGQDYYGVEPYYMISTAIFNAFKIYAMGVAAGVSELNPYLEAARWMGALVTTSIVVVVIRHILNEIRLRWKLRSPEAVVVHGDGLKKETVARALGKNGIPARGDICFKARDHVLAFESDSAAIRYVMEHEKSLADPDKNVYFSSTEYEASDYIQTGFTVSNTATNCARLYWQQHWLKDDSIRKVAIVGFGHFGQRLLEQALLVNVLPWRGPIEYHIFGSDGKDFLAWRPQLAQCLAINQADTTRDSLHFHSSLVSEGVAAIQGMDRIILTLDDVDDSLLRLNHLLHTGVTGVIHIRCSSKILAQLQYLPQRQMANGLLELTAFGDDQELFSREVLLHGKLCEAARNAHVSYVRQSSAENISKKYPSCGAYRFCKRRGDCGDCPHAPATWDDLTPFEKSSNIAAADHEPIKRVLLQAMAEKGGREACYEDLCRTEHTRWMRFYYLHNWQYAPVRDDNHRKHPCLVPFDQLSKAEQEKDWWAYETILQEDAR